MNKNNLHSDITALILKAFFKVYNTLGYGFLEKVYQNAMMIELRKLGLECEAEKAVIVYYDDQVVGYYDADILVSNLIMVELKASTALIIKDEAQLLNYMNGTVIEVGLLLNFGPKPEFKRKVFSNESKDYRSLP
ncbi:MAG TPA: GxxExxY protein [Saprospiraceae bacterium]|nr:GxxExxY protein [Saprospiraceae bacterium]